MIGKEPSERDDSENLIYKGKVPMAVESTLVSLCKAEWEPMTSIPSALHPSINADKF